MKQAYRQTADHFLIHTAVEAEYEEMIARIKAMNPAVFMEDLQEELPPKFTRGMFVLGNSRLHFSEDFRNETMYIFLAPSPFMMQYIITARLKLTQLPQLLA